MVLIAAKFLDGASNMDDDAFDEMMPRAVKRAYMIVDACERGRINERHRASKAQAKRLKRRKA